MGGNSSREPSPPRRPKPSTSYRYEEPVFVPITRMHAKPSAYRESTLTVPACNDHWPTGVNVNRVASPLNSQATSQRNVTTSPLSPQATVQNSAANSFNRNTSAQRSVTSNVYTNTSVNSQTTAQKSVTSNLYTSNANTSVTSQTTAQRTTTPYLGTSNANTSVNSQTTAQRSATSNLYTGNANTSVNSQTTAQRTTTPYVGTSNANTSVNSQTTAQRSATSNLYTGNANTSVNSQKTAQRTTTPYLGTSNANTSVNSQTTAQRSETSNLYTGNANTSINSQATAQRTAAQNFYNRKANTDLNSQATAQRSTSPHLFNKKKNNNNNGQFRNKTFHQSPANTTNAQQQRRYPRSHSPFGGGNRNRNQSQDRFQRAGGVAAVESELEKVERECERLRLELAASRSASDGIRVVDSEMASKHEIFLKRLVGTFSQDCLMRVKGFYCAPCDEYLVFTKANKACHKESDTHKSNVQRNPRVREHICQTCKAVFYGDQTFWIEHLKMDLHRRMVERAENASRRSRYDDATNRENVAGSVSSLSRSNGENTFALTKEIKENFLGKLLGTDVAYSFYCHLCQLWLTSSVHWADHNERHLNDPVVSATFKNCNKCKVMMVGSEELKRYHSGYEEHSKFKDFLNAESDEESGENGGNASDEDNNSTVGDGDRHQERPRPPRGNATAIVIKDLPEAASRDDVFNYFKDFGRINILRMNFCGPNTALITFKFRNVAQNIIASGIPIKIKGQTVILEHSSFNVPN